MIVLQQSSIFDKLHHARENICSLESDIVIWTISLATILICTTILNKLIAITKRLRDLLQNVWCWLIDNKIVIWQTTVVVLLNVIVEMIEMNWFFVVIVCFRLARNAEKSLKARKRVEVDIKKRAWMLFYVTSMSENLDWSLILSARAHIELAWSEAWRTIYFKTFRSLMYIFAL